MVCSKFLLFIATLVFIIFPAVDKGNFFHPETEPQGTGMDLQIIKERRNLQNWKSESLITQS